MVNMNISLKKLPFKVKRSGGEVKAIGF